MESSRTELSKMEIMLDFASTGYTSQQIIHINCDCLMCVNDVRPIVPPEQPRERSQNQTCILSPDAMLYLLKKCVNYKGSISIPEIIFLQEGMLFYSNDLGRLRMKDKVTNIQAKKFFDDRKQKTRYSSKNLQKQRQSYVLVYKTGSQQILNQAHYTKILSKRKNDPFWLQVSYSYKMPDSKQIQPPLKIYQYKRTKSVASRMISTLQKVMNEVDSQESRLYREKEEGVMNNSMLTLPDNLQNSIINNNSINFKGISQQLNRLGNTIPQNSLEFAGSNVFKNQRSKFRIFSSIKVMVQQIIAYLQVCFKTRVLQIQVQYTEIEGDPVILNTRKLIVCEVPLEQQCYLHDRYKPIDAIGLKQLVELKKIYDSKDEETLWSVCGQILESCLQQRKIKLKVQNYKKPSKLQLKQIFIKFFPDFSPQQMFENINWKNELSEFMSESKIKINKIIQSDQGISILKRFGIYFFRTF